MRHDGTMRPRRRRLLQSLALGVALSPLATLAQGPARTAITVYKSPLCGCCEDWVKHLRDHGFAVSTQNVEDTGPWRQRLGMPERFASCHTGLMAGYAIEGHVPAADIRRLLATQPKAAGLAVPAMPLGSPGMDQGPRKDPYDVLLVKADGTATVFASYNKAKA